MRAVVRMERAFSLCSLEKLLRGSRDRAICLNGLDTLPEHGAARGLNAPLVRRMLRLLVARGMLVDDCMPSAHGSFSSRLRLGPHASMLWTTALRGAKAGPGADVAPSWSVFDPTLAGVVLLPCTEEPSSKRKARLGGTRFSFDDTMERYLYLPFALHFNFDLFWLTRASQALP